MRISVKKYIPDETVISFEAESEAELWQLAAVTGQLKSAGAPSSEFNDLEGSRGTLIRIKNIQPT